MAVGLSVKPSLQEGVTSPDDRGDNRACWFLYNVHTRTGNRLLSSTQPPLLLVCSYSHTHSVSGLSFEACAATDSLHMHQELLNSFPHNTTNFLRGVLRLLKTLLSVDKTQTSPHFCYFINPQLRRTADGYLEAKSKSLIYRKSEMTICSRHRFSTKHDSSAITFNNCLIGC